MGSFSLLSREAKMFAAIGSSLIIGMTIVSQGGALWRAIGLPVMATEFHVASQLEEKIKPLAFGLTELRARTEDVELATATMMRQQLDSEIFRLQQIIATEQKPDTLHVINERVRRLAEEREFVSKRIITLSKDRLGSAYK